MRKQGPGELAGEEGAPDRSETRFFRVWEGGRNHGGRIGEVQGGQDTEVALTENLRLLCELEVKSCAERR